MAAPKEPKPGDPIAWTDADGRHRRYGRVWSQAPIIGGMAAPLWVVPVEGGSVLCVARERGGHEWHTDPRTVMVTGYARVQADRAREPGGVTVYAPRAGLWGMTDRLPYVISGGAS